MILRSDILDCLPVISIDIDADNCVVEVWVGALQDIIVLVLFVVKSIQTFENEFKDRSQVLW